MFTRALSLFTLQNADLVEGRKHLPDDRSRFAASGPLAVPDGGAAGRIPVYVVGKGESLYLYVLSSNQHNKKMENKEKETTVSKFAENPYVEIKKRVSMAGVWSVLVAVVAFVASGFMTDPQSSLKLFLIVVGVCFIIYGLIKLAVGNKVAVCRANGKVLKKT